MPKDFLAPSDYAVPNYIGVSLDHQADTVPVTLTYQPGLHLYAIWCRHCGFRIDGHGDDMQEMSDAMTQHEAIHHQEKP